MLAETLKKWVGKDSELMPTLDPTSTDGLLAARQKRVNEELTKEFSLDKKGSALSRLKKTIEDFKSDILTILTGTAARKEESERGTQKGRDFEEQVFNYIKRLEPRCGPYCETRWVYSGALGAQ